MNNKGAQSLAAVMTVKVDDGWPLEVEVKTTAFNEPKEQAMQYVHYLFLMILLGCRYADGPILPSEAAKKVGEKVTVEMEVKSVGRGKSGVYFLSSESNYKTDGNFTLFIPKAGAAKFKKAGISDPAEHFNGKRVRANGTVKLYKDRPEIVVEDPKQIELIEK